MITQNRKTIRGGELENGERKRDRITSINQMPNSLAGESIKGYPQDIRKVKEKNS